MTISEAVFGDRGETLVESLMSVAIMAITFAAILGAFAVSATTSHLKASQGTLTTGLVTSAESIKAAAYQSCASTSSYSTGNPLVTVQSVNWWNPSLNSSGQPIGWSSGVGCQSGTSNDKLQLLQLQATDPHAVGLNGADTETLYVVKRNGA